VLLNSLRVVSGTLFFPRGGSAFVTRALVRGLDENGVDVSLVAGSRRDLGDIADARAFYAGSDLHEVDFSAALAAADPMASDTPMQPSYEDRPGAADRVFAALDDDAYERQVTPWADALKRARAAEADVLHLHHLTPLNAAAERVAPDVPIVGHLHGTELLMLEAIANGPPTGWAYAEQWAQRLRRWAAACERLVVAPGNRERAVALLDLPLKRFTVLPNGFDPVAFRPLDVDRRAVWQRMLGDAATVQRLMRGPVIVFVGRFTEVKRIPLLLEAFAAAQPQFDVPATLVLVGGHPGEWEGEHPADAIARLGLSGDAVLAGWHDQSELPELLAASDLLVLPSERESFGQVIVEAMACGVPPIAAASLGPAHIIRDGQTGWLFDIDDRRALTNALVDGVNNPAERARRAKLGEQAALDRFTWPAVSQRLARVLDEARTPPARRTRSRTVRG